MIPQIYLYRILYYTGFTAMCFTVVYSIIYETWWLLAASYFWSRFVGLLANQIAQHRYFAHRAFTTTPVKHKFLIWFSILGGEGSPMAWATHHRHHHKHSDKDLDIHSPHESKSLCIYKWQTKSLNWWLQHKKVTTIPKDLLRDKTIKFVDKNYYKIWFFLILISFAIDWKFCIFFILAPVGQGIVSGAVGNFCGHWKLPGSYRNFETDDKTYNNRFVAAYLGGEGLHNNHHHLSSAYNQAVKENEFDLGGWIIEKFFVIKV